MSYYTLVFLQISRPYQDGNDSLVHKSILAFTYFWRQNYEKKTFLPNKYYFCVMSGCIAHVNALPAEGTVALDMDAHQIITRLGSVFFTHRIQRQVGDVAYLALVPVMDMTAEDNGCIPMVELVQQVVGFLAGEGGGELRGRRPEDVGMAENKSMADLYFIHVWKISFEKM